MSETSVETPPAQSPPSPPPPAPPGRFEEFMSDSIGAALKENPRLPSLQKERGPDQPDTKEPQADTKEPQADTKTPQADTKEPQADTTSPLLPDFSKLAFGQEIAAKLPSPEIQKDLSGKDGKTIQVPAPEAIPSPDQFPEKFPGKTTPQVEQAWGSMRRANKTLFEKNAELSTQLKEAQDKLKDFEGKLPMAQDEFERITTERETLNKELRLAKLEATPEYKSAVSRPLEQIEGEVKRLSHKYSVNEHQVRRALVEPDPDKQSELLAQITETFNDRDKLNLFKVADAAIEITRKRDVLHKDVKQALDYIEAKRNQEAEQKAIATKNEWSSSLTKAWDQVGEALYLARPIEGNDPWNSSLQEAKQLVARTDLSVMTPIDRAKVMVQAALLPRACIAIQQLWGMYSEAAKALQRYQGVTPGAGGGRSGAGTEATAPAVPDETSFLDAIEAKIKGR